MSLLKRICAALLCVGLVLMLFGCAPATQEEGPTTEPLTLCERYDAAAQALQNAENLILRYTAKLTRTVGNDPFVQTVTGNASYAQNRDASMTAIVEENLRYGSYEVDYEEIYCGGSAYVQFDGKCFGTQLSADAFLNRQIPAVLAQSSLYAQVEEVPNEDGISLIFREPKAAESWAAVPAGAAVQEAWAMVTLDSSDVLTASSYYIRYLLGQTQYTYEVTVQAAAPKVLDLTGRHPEHFPNSVPLEDLNVPKLLLKAVGDIYSAEHMSCQAQEKTYSEAIPVTYIQESSFFVSGWGDSLSAEAVYKMTMSDYREEVSVTTQTDRFQAGKFTTERNGEAPQENPAVTAQLMRQYCEDAILSAVLAPKYLAMAQSETADGVQKLTFQGNTAFVTDLMTNIGQFLQVDLGAQAQSSALEKAEGYLHLDEETGLPVAMGLKLSCRHTINGVVYSLTYDLVQTLDLVGK